jgi:hypothetical protein
MIQIERVYVHATTENGSTVCIGGGGASLGCRAQRENGMKVLVVRLLVKAKGTNIIDEFGEGSG